MIRVHLIITGRTNLYASDEVLNFIAEYEMDSEGGTRINLVEGKLQKWAMMGLRNCPELKAEGEQVFRLRVASSGRLIGFFALEDFILVSAFEKKGQKKPSSKRHYQ
ncbi:MAG: hypothetical protein M3Y08_08130 [Fibrobacterota bacterium]|nr:hypothetical protein [Fibrobacterota bacterium]